MENLNQYFETLYDNFNQRNIELVINNMARDVKWANGMEGGYVNGHQGVREYWTKQFKMVSSKVTPLEISEENDEVRIKVRQVVHDLEGNLLGDDLVTHVFKLEGERIIQFDIENT
jgi:hypothetical protein